MGGQGERLSWGHPEQRVEQEIGVTATACPKCQRLCVGQSTGARQGWAWRCPRDRTVAVVWSEAEPGEGDRQWGGLGCWAHK